MVPATCCVQTLSQRQILWSAVAVFIQALVSYQNKSTGTLGLEHQPGLGKPMPDVHEALGLALPFTFADWQNNNPSAGSVLQIA